MFPGFLEIVFPESFVGEVNNQVIMGITVLVKL